MAYSVERLVSIGGKEWRRAFKNGREYHRVYFCNRMICQVYGLRIVTFDLEWIESATLDGKEIGFKEAKTILSKIDRVKIWYDLSYKDFYAKGDKEITGVVIERIKTLARDAGEKEKKMLDLEELVIERMKELHDGLHAEGEKDP